METFHYCLGGGYAAANLAVLLWAGVPLREIVGGSILAVLLVACLYLSFCL